MLKIPIYSVSGREYEQLEKYNYDYDNQTIILNSLEDLITLPQALNQEIIIDRAGGTLEIYDDYIE